MVVQINEVVAVVVYAVAVAAITIKGKTQQIQVSIPQAASSEPNFNR